MMWDLRGASRSPVPPPVIIPNTGPVAFPTPLNNLPPYEFPPPYAPLMSEPVVNGYGSNHIPFPASSPGYSPGYGHHGSRAPTPQAASPHYHHRTLSSAEHRHYTTPQPVPRSRSQSFTTQQGHHARALSNSQGHHHSRSHSRPRHDSHQSQNHGRSHSRNHSRSHSRNHNGHAQQVAISQPIAAPYVPTTHHRSHSRSHSRSRHHHHHHHHQPQSQPQQPQVQFALRPEQYPEVPRMLGLSHHNVNTHAPAHNVPRPTHQSRTHPKFCYSKCTGRRKAVCIGINYAGSRNELQGCVNDATHVYHFLNEKYRYPRESMLFLTDTLSDPRARPTKKNILRAMQWLVEDAHPHDSLFFHYSGHGGQTKDLDGDEVDGYDEVIFPEDYQSAGTLTDDVMHDVMVRPLPPGCRLTAVFDSCHSGSILDLPYLYHSNGRAKGSQVSARFRADKTTPADVISWSGCKDSQTSADTTQNGVAVGAMSYAFMKVLKRNPDISYQDLLRGIRAILKERYSQKPQLSSSHRIDTNLRFIM